MFLVFLDLLLQLLEPGSSRLAHRLRQIRLGCDKLFHLLYFHKVVFARLFTFGKSITRLGQREDG